MRAESGVGIAVIVSLTLQQYNLMNDSGVKTASNANRFSSWQGVYSWIEPVAGSRREWKDDHWRFWKIAACLVPVFFACAWKFGSITLLFLKCMAGVAAFTYAYLWLFSFFPRRIVLFDDRISIFRTGSRGASAAITIDFSDIQEMNTTPESRMFHIKLKLISGKETILYSSDENSACQLDKLLRESNAARVPPKVVNP